MEPRRNPASDGISRFLSVLAILVALGSTVFLYQENQGLKTELATIKGTDEAPKSFEDHAAQWNTKLTMALDDFTGKADTYLEKFDAAREARNRLAQADSERETDLAAGLTRDAVEQIVDQQIKLAAMKPNLAIAQTALKPTESSEAVPLMIANDGEVDAQIISARFLPKPGGQFRVRPPTEIDDNQVVIEFEPKHNQPTKAEHHKLYERSFLVGHLVAQKKMVKVTVEIHANGKHLGWGMEGELELMYQDGRSLLIPGAQAVFVPEPVEPTST